MHPELGGCVDGLQGLTVPMPFACHTPGGQVRLDDLTLTELERIEALTGYVEGKHGPVQVTWDVCITSPAQNIRTARAIYQVCCEHTSSTPEELTLRDLRSGRLFELVEDDSMPDFDDTRDFESNDAGSLTLDPKADAAATATSSGA